MPQQLCATRPDGQAEHCHGFRMGWHVSRRGDGAFGAVVVRHG